MRYALLSLALVFGGTASAAELITADDRAPTYAQNGAAVTVGGGVTSTEEEGLFSDEADVGGLWEVRGLWGTRSIFGAELAYVGTSRDLPGDDRMLISNGGEVALRLAAPMALDDEHEVVLAPFAFGGIGYSWYNVVSDADDDNGEGAFHAPIGAGISMGYGGVWADARVSWREALDQDDTNIVGAPNDLDLSGLSIGANVGVEF